MNISLENRSLYIYQFPSDNIFKSDTIHRFILDFSAFCKYQLITDLSDDRLQDSTAIVLFIVSSIEQFQILERQKYPYSNIKIIAYFLSSDEFSIVDVTNFRRPLKARGFHFIYPDLIIDRSRLDLVYPSCIKTFDLVYSKTDRNKFLLEYLGEDIEQFTQIDPNSEIAKIIEIGYYLHDMRLNDDSFAGGIAIRFGGGFLITASRTNKYAITPDRIVYVESYDPVSNIVWVVGAHYPPSSETALFYSCFREFPDVNVILHFHHKPITVGRQFARYRTDSYTPYGTWAEAEIVTDKLRKTQDFAIASSHGEFSIGATFEDVKGTIDRIINFL